MSLTACDQDVLAILTSLEQVAADIRASRSESGDHVGDPMRQRLSIPGRHEVLFRQQLGYATNVRPHAGQGPSHGLDHRPWQTLLARWQNKQVGLIQLLANSLSPRDVPQERDILPESEPGCAETSTSRYWPSPRTRRVRG